MLERTVKKRLMAILEKTPSCYARAIAGSRENAGWPDIVVSYKGRMIALEVKVPGGPDATKRRSGRLSCVDATVSAKADQVGAPDE